MAQDYLRKFLFENFPVKGSIVRLQESWREVCERAEPPEHAGRLLAQSLCASVLLASNIKFKGSVSLQVQSSGALKLLLGQCTHRYGLRGVARMNPVMNDELLLEAVLSINLEPADGGMPYQGIIEMDQSDLAPALQAYFARSEQLESRFWLAAGKRTCCGMMLQRMPGPVIEDDSWDRVTHLAATLTDHELLTLEPEPLLRRLFHQEDIRLFKPAPVSFDCKCSIERVDIMIRGLGEVEALDILREAGVVEVKCEYCGKTYEYDPVDIGRLFAGNGLPVRDYPGVH